MPRWGLTENQRKMRPWGLPEELLSPSKTITDPVHEDIYVTELERRFIDSPPLQRLRRVKQLGTTQMVYPGAVHNRFQHSLGALRAAQDLLDAVVSHGQGPYKVPDLFEQWAMEPDYDLRVAEATTLARLGALLHDLCHVPFGHSIEDDLKILIPHDANEERFNYFWMQFPDALRAQISPELFAELKPLILSKNLDAECDSKYPFVADIVGNTICADLLDYLPRDHLFTGLPARLGHRFIDGFYVTPRDHLYSPSRMAIQIARGGHLRADVVSELFKYLRYRYELSERALVHPAKLAADAMVGKALEMWADSLWVELAKSRVKGKKELSGLDLDAMRESIPTADADEIDSIVTARIEQELRMRGDEGLLEYLRDQTANSNDRRKIGIHRLVEGLLERPLFKLAARCTTPTLAKPIYEKFGDRDVRRRLEQDVAQFAGLEHKWQVVLWIPAPTMRLKAAEVLVDDGTQVAQLQQLDEKGQNRGKEIYDSHAALWAFSVFVDKNLSELQKEVVRAYLSDKMGGLVWEGHGRPPSVPKLAAAEVARRENLSIAAAKELSDRSEVAAKGAAPTFEGLLETLSTATAALSGALDDPAAEAGRLL